MSALVFLLSSGFLAFRVSEQERNKIKWMHCAPFGLTCSSHCDHEGWHLIFILFICLLGQHIQISISVNVSVMAGGLVSQCSPLARCFEDLERIKVIDRLAVA